jgi:hypothetical protein
MQNQPQQGQPRRNAIHSRQQNIAAYHRMSSSDVLDADFERVDLSKVKEKEIRDKSVTAVEDDDDSIDAPKSLLDLSLDLDPEWKETRIPFVDAVADGSNGENYIDGKLAFTIDLDGVTYGIAVPFDHGAAIVVEEPDGSVVYLSPDDDENVELMEIMARQLQEHVDEDLKLQRTPRVLTISGDLLKYTDKWQDELLPKPVDVDTLLEDEDESVEGFREFMRKELGEEEYAKTIQEAAMMTSNDIDDEIMELFNIPGIGESKDDVEGIEKMLKSMMSDEDEDESFPGINKDKLDQEGVALKLISYRFGDGKAYSLVYLLKPFALVGKYVSDETDVRFELLKPDEERIVIPKIEELCREDMERAGLTLATR